MSGNGGTTPDPGVVVFDYEAWLARFPEFNGRVTEAQATEFFFEAGMMLNNTSCSIVQDMTQRASLLGLLTAHMAQLSALTAAAGAAGSGSPLVGPVQSVSQGSISISVQPLAGAGANAMQAWLSQTQYGARYWVLTAGLRTMRYIPGPQPVFDRPLPYGAGTEFPWPWR
jgi:hypothetical protein